MTGRGQMASIEGQETSAGDRAERRSCVSREGQGALVIGEDDQDSSGLDHIETEQEDLSRIQVAAHRERGYDIVLGEGANPRSSVVAVRIAEAATAIDECHPRRHGRGTRGALESISAVATPRDVMSVLVLESLAA